MPVIIPEDLLHLILENVPIAIRISDGRKQGWEFFEGLSLASRLSRKVALKYWFSTLRIHNEGDWEYLSEHVWISQLVRALQCSGTAWKGCYTVNLGEEPLRMGLTLKDLPLQALDSFSRLDAVVCDMRTLNPWGDMHVQAVLLEKFIHALPQSVASVELMHAPILPVTILSKITHRLPELRVLNLGKCIVHCPCASCTQRIEGLGGSIGGSVYLQHLRRFQFLELAEQIAPLAHLHTLKLNAHLTQPWVVTDHRRHHARSFAMADCPNCPVEAFKQTLEKERTGAMAFAKALPALTTVEWCSLFGKSGRRSFVIHRNEAGDISLETDS